VRQLRAAGRVLGVLAHIFSGLATIYFVFPKLSPEQRHDRVQAWSAQMLQRLGVGLVVLGAPAAQGPMLLVSNHISWLDITSLHAARFCRFVSKADVKHWPVIGRLAVGTDTLFIEREKRRDAMRVVHHMTERLQAGDVLGIFPEGTTSNGEGLLPFHANLLQAAIAANAPVQPLALRFVDSTTGRQSLAPCYIGDDTLIGSFWRTLKADPISVVVRFGEPQRFEGRDRRVWAADLQAEVDRLRQLPLA
jgi:1-acyl-sn-glycerol-3-phosphate acyltransferase